MSDNRHSEHFRNMVEFIPLKTMSMDLDSILSTLAKVYVNRSQTGLVELITLAEAELFPIGSFDEQAQRYEYVLKLSVPVNFFNHQKHAITDLQQQLHADLQTITAAYLHEFISEVFVCIKIEQDPQWRERVLDFIGKQADHRKSTGPELTLYHAGADAGSFCKELERALSGGGKSAGCAPLVSVKEKDLHHLLGTVEQPAMKTGVFIISPALVAMPFPQESKELIASHILAPEGRCFQVWEAVSRAEVADFHPGLARSLAYASERMAPGTIAGHLMSLCAGS
jgi:hypothetical protein